MPANNGIPELKVTGPVRGLVPAAFALAALCFFLSFGELRYYGLRVAGMTGMDLVLGHPPRPDPEGIAEVHKLGQVQDLALAVLDHWSGHEAVQQAKKELKGIVGPQAAEQVRELLMDDVPHVDDIPDRSGLWAAVALIISLTGVMISFLRLRAEAVIWPILSAVGITSMLFLQQNLQLPFREASERVQSAGPGLLAQVLGLDAAPGPGFMIAVGALAAAGVLAFLRIRDRSLFSARR